MSKALTKANGNMYPWVTHTHSHLGGKCPHACRYCYVQQMAKRYPVMAEQYSGALRILDGSLDVKYGKGKMIFVDHMNDLFAREVLDMYIDQVLRHCHKWPDNGYCFQTKNTVRALDMEQLFLPFDPKRLMIGTTIESNRRHEAQGNTISVQQRAHGLRLLKYSLDCQTFVTIEPIMDFDVEALTAVLLRASPDFVNIGADSKGSDLDEPPWWKIEGLIYELGIRSVDIRQKSNLFRLQK